MQSNAKGPAVSSYVSRRTTKGPGFYISFLIFFIAVLVSIGVFVYTKIIQGSIDTKLAEIDRLQKAYEPSTMKELIRADTRMKHADILIENHVTPSEYLRLLEQITIHNLRYDSLGFTTNGTVGTGAARNSQNISVPTVALTGQAGSFKQIALQADEFGANRDLQNPVVSGLNIDANDLAVFSVTMNVEPRFVSYTEAIKTGRRATSQVSAPTPTMPVSEVAPVSPEPAATVTATSSTTE